MLLRRLPISLWLRVAAVVVVLLAVVVVRAACYLAHHILFL
jgi:hypothetical protein